jgi:CheY-like chemotaxis protein
MRDILIADDDASLRRALKLALEAAGYHVRLAAHGGEALALQRQAPADVLITDIFMPESDGFEAIDSFRMAFPATKIVAMSGGSTRTKHAYLPAAALAGADATLAKPFQVDTLLSTLRALVGAPPAA